MTILHSHLASGRWLNLSLAEQLANIGSEFERALQWKERGRPQFFESAAARMTELMDLTINDKRWHNHRLKELTRIREVVCGELYKEILDKKSINGLKKYFLNFAYLAQMNK